MDRSMAVGNPFFSVIMVTKNSSFTIGKSLQSLKDQTCSDFELIVQDSNSRDDTIKIALSFFKDAKVSVEADSGIYNGINKALERCKGKFIFFLHSNDELYDDEVLAEVKKFLKKHDNIEMYAGGCKLSVNHYIHRVWWPTNLFQRTLGLNSIPPHTSTFVKRSIFKMIGNFNESYNISADFDWLERALRALDGTKIARKRRLICKMSSGGASSNYKRSYFEDVNVAREYYRFPRLTISLKKLRKLLQLRIGG